MESIKGIELNFDKNEWNIGIAISIYDTDPSFLWFSMGPFSLTINKLRYFKNGLLSVSDS